MTRKLQDTAVPLLCLHRTSHELAAVALSEVWLRWLNKAKSSPYSLLFYSTYTPVYSTGQSSFRLNTNDTLCYKQCDTRMIKKALGKKNNGKDRDNAEEMTDGMAMVEALRSRRKKL